MAIPRTSPLVPTPPVKRMIWLCDSPTLTYSKPPLLSSPPIYAGVMVWSMATPPQPFQMWVLFLQHGSYEATFQPFLTLLIILLSFNAAPKFLGVAFGQTLSFGAYVHPLASSSTQTIKLCAPLLQLTGFPLKSEESIFLLYEVFMRPLQLSLCLFQIVSFPLHIRWPTNQKFFTELQATFSQSYFLLTPNRLFLCLQRPPNISCQGSGRVGDKLVYLLHRES